MLEPDRQELTVTPKRPLKKRHRFKVEAKYDGVPWSSRYRAPIPPSDRCHRDT